MGAEPWDYFVPFEPDVRVALERLRRQVFRSGDYRGSELEPSSIAEAMENMDADGTASILDIDHVSDEPEFCAVCPLADDRLQEFFGTTQPTRAMIEEALMELYEDIERGQGIYIIAYENGSPSEIFFGGYSFD
jgi:hypothetical protein